LSQARASIQRMLQSAFVLLLLIGPVTPSPTHTGASCSKGDGVDLIGCRREMKKREVVLEWSTGSYTVHEYWLLDNRADWRHKTGQKIRHVDLEIAPKLDSVQCNGTGLWASWEGEAKAIHFAIDFLKHWATPDELPSRQPPSLTASSWRENSGHDYFKVMTSDTGLFGFMEELHDNGVAFMHSAPPNEETVSKVTSRMGGTLEQLYGKTFSVKSSVINGPKNNIAYTNVQLNLHMDLVYYESMPGYQFLHCLQFDEGIEGGESLLLDSFKVAEELRRNDPAAFRSLQEIPATFIKDDMRRERPAQFEYRTPHIQTHPNGDIFKVVWSPPFEGPLVLQSERVEEYYRAKKAFELALHNISKTHLMEFKLKEGQILAFNNARMLHGRNEFGNAEGKNLIRNLQGAYVNGDEFRNKLQVMRKLVLDESRPVHKMFHQGNRCS